MFPSRKTKNFDKAFRKLPPEIQEAAKKAFKQWLENPFHPSLHFKCVDEKRDIWSIRVSLNYRALAYRKEGVYFWDWIGNHREYEKKLRAKR